MKMATSFGERYNSTERKDCRSKQSELIDPYCGYITFEPFLKGQERENFVIL
jgi:hypothetical protein